MSNWISFRALQNRVLEYAIKNYFLKDLGEIDYTIKTDFILTLAVRRLVPKREPIDVDETIRSKRNLFLNWYLFERDFINGKTIGELYIESKDFKEDFEASRSSLREDFENLRRPRYNVFTVVGKKERDEYVVMPLEGMEELLVHDRSTFQQVHIGEAIYGVLYPFGGRYYIGDDGLLKIPENEMKKYYRTKSLARLLEEKFEDFMEMKSGLKERTKQEKEEMFSHLLEYVYHKGYTKLKQIEKMNVDNWIRCTRRRLMFFSRTREDAYRRGFRQFHKHVVQDKGTNK